MVFDPHANLAYSLVSVAPVPAASGTSLTLSAGDGSIFPDPLGIGYEVTVWPIAAFPLITNAEILRVTAKVGDVLTITRAQGGTNARTILVGDQIALTVTRKVIEDLETVISAPLLVSAGASSALVSALTFSNSNGVSFGLNAGTITGTVATNYQSQGAYLTTAALSQDSSKYAGTNGAITGGSITVNTSGISVNLPAYLTTALGSGASTQFVQANANFFGTNASGTIQSNAISISVSAPGATASSWTVSDNATSGTVARLAFTNLNGVTLSLSSGTGGLHTIVGSHNALTTAMASNRGSDFVQATAVFNGTNATGTIASGALSVSVAAPVPIATAVNDVASANSTGTITRYAPEDHRHAGIGAIGISTSGNTAGTTKSVQGTYWFQGGNNITVSQITSNNGSHTLVLSGANAGGAQTGISGIVASDTTYTSGTVSFSAQNNITIGSSVNGATQYIRLSVGNYLTTAMASNRASDFVQATAVFNGTNATGTIASGAISVSVAAPIPIATSVNPVASASSVGTVTRYAPEDHRHPGVGAVGISTSGNTAGTTGSVIGTYWFEGGNSLTVSQITSNNGSHTLRLSVGNYLTTAMASNRASDFVQATAVFNGTNATGTIASGAISVSVAALIPLATTVLSVASANSVGTVTRYAAEDHRHAGVGGVGISTSGGTAGTTGSVLGTYWFQGGNNVTVSQITSNNGSHTLVISGANVGGAQTGISGIVASDTTYTSGTVSFSAQNAITIGSSVNGATQYVRLSVASPIPIATAVNDVASANSTGTVTRYAPEDHRHAGIGAAGISTSGNTAGTTGSKQGTYWFEGGNSITVSQITSNNGSHTLVISAGAYLTTAMASNRASDFVQATAVFNGTNATGTIASGAISVSVAAPIPLATTVLSVASANSVGTVTRYAAEDHRHAGVGGIGISTSGNTAGTTGSVLGTYWFQGGNSITVSQITSNNGSHTLVISAGAYLTTAMASNRGTDFVQATAGFNGTNASGTIASNSISVSVAAPIPIATTVNPVASANSTGTVTRYAPEDHKHAGIGGIGISTSGNTAGTTGSVVGTYWFQGGNNITVSQITSNNGSHTLVLSAGSAAAAPVNFSAGTTSGNLGSVVFSDSNGISFGLNGSTITASANTVGTATTYYPVASANSVGTVSRWAAEDHRHAGVGGVGISTSGNTTGTTGSQVGTYWYEGRNNITLSQITSNNGSHTLAIIGNPLLSEFEPFQGVQPVTNSVLGQSTVYFVPFNVQAAISASRINFYLSLTHTYSGAPNNSTAWMAMGYALYTRGTGASTDRISVLTSYSLSYISASVSSSTRLSVTNYNGLLNTTSHSTTQYGVNNASVSDYLGSSIAGFRVIALPLNLTMTPGRYWLGFSNQSASQGASLIFSHTVIQQQLSNNLAFRVFNTVSAASNASVWGASAGVGTYSAQTAAFPDTIPLTASAIKMGPIVTFPHFNISGIGTSNVIM